MRWGQSLALTLFAGSLPCLAVEPAALTDFLTAELSASNMPGLRAAVRFSDGREVSAAVGYADLESGKNARGVIVY